MAAIKRTLPAPPELQSHWASVLEEAGRRPAILALSDRYPEERSLTVPFSDVDRVDTSLADLLLERPEELLDAGQRAMRELLPVADADSAGLRMRVIGLPPTAHRLIREIRESDLNRFIALDGIVRRVTEVRPQIRDAVFQCVACRTEFHEPQDEASMVFREPLECPESQGGCGKPQGRTRFRLLPEKSAYVDAQRIEIQENPEILKHGAHPQGLAVMLTEDLAGQVLPGNRVVVNGVLKSFQRASASRGGVVRNTTFDLLVLGNSVEWKQQEYDEIEITPEEERLFLTFRGDPTVVDKIVMSLAPTIKGMEEEKEAIALQLFGGVEKRHPDGVRVRGDIHALIVGDPGTAKSQLLRYVAEVAPRGIYTSGKGATAAGLTAAAVKDDFAGGRWVLEAGMLVLADGGMAVIDELDKMSPDDRSAMHEALEQQSQHPDFEIMLSNGEHRRIGSLVDELMSRNPDRVISGRDCEVLPLEGDDLSLLTTDFHGMHPVPADRVSRHKAPPNFVRVRYANGRILTVTPEHPLFVWRAGKWAVVPAESVRPGDLAPGVSHYPRHLNEATFHPPEHRSGRKEMVFPNGLDGDLSRLLGYIVSEGHMPSIGQEAPSEVLVANTDVTLAEDARTLFRSLFGIEPYFQVTPPTPRTKATRPLYSVRAVGVDLVAYFHSNFPELARKSPSKRIPGSIFHATEDCRIEFLLGAFRGDGFYDSERFGITTSSEGLARDYSDVLLSLGIYSYLARSHYTYGAGRTNSLFKVVVSGASSQRTFYERIARRDSRAEKIQSFVERSEKQSTDQDWLPPEFASRLKALLGQFGLDTNHVASQLHSDRSCHRQTALRHLGLIEAHVQALRASETEEWSGRRRRRAWHLPLSAVADSFRRSVAWVGMYDNDSTTRQGREIRDGVADLASKKSILVLDEIRALYQWARSPIRYVPIRAVDVISNPGEKWVYDVTVEPTHTFVSEGLVLHNTVSIAKAGITSTLNARCPVLAAANPKWGRFTNDRTIAEQIDLPPTLLSRFDVIFSIRDHPNQERDRRLADGILASHREGESRIYAPNERRSSSGAPFPPELLKKYIAYAKRTVRPILSSPALAALSDYYVKVRAQGEEPDSPVPITARQLEALIRLSEAAAKARLSGEVGVEDAQRAIQIMQNFLKRVAMTEGGKLDVDLVQSGVSHSQRERLDIVMRVMRELQDRPEPTFTLEEYLAASERAGVPANRAEALLQTLRNQGEIIEARPNRLQLVRF